MERRKPGPAPRFTREEVARCALTIMDVHGSDGLTMRGLAETLGMGTMALYRYFPSKTELTDAAIDLAVGEIELPPRGTRSWKEQLARLARELFDTGLRHPSLTPERFDPTLPGPGAKRVTDHVVALLLEAGLSKRDAVAAFKALIVHTLGTAALVAPESRPGVRRKASEQHASLGAERLPAITAVAREFGSARGGEQAFAFGLGALLDGIELRKRR